MTAEQYDKAPEEELAGAKATYDALATSLCKEPYTTIGWVHSLMAYNTAGQARDCSLILHVCAPVVIIGWTDCLVHTGPWVDEAECGWGGGGECVRVNHEQTVWR